MRDDEWTVIAGILEECWPGEWTRRTGPAYRLMLEGYDPSAIVAAIRQWARRGFGGRPSASAIISVLEADPSRPTWTEVREAIFGRGGILRARPSRAGAVLRYDSEGERRGLEEAAMVERARERFHPTIAAFAESYGVGRLRELGVHDERYGELRMKDLREAWEEFQRRAEERGARGLPLSTGGRKGLRGMQPLAALGMTPPARPELEVGDE